MKMQCEIIRDLIPLIEDDVCSLQSKEAVLEHIKTCERCRQLYENSRIKLSFELSVDEDKAQKSIKKGFKKIKRRWMASILMILLLFPITLLSWGQIQGRGLSFTNINEFMIANAFFADLKRGDYDSAFLHLDIESLREEWLNEWFDKEKLENFENDAQRVFHESASLLIDAGGIENYEFLAIDDNGDYYRIYYTLVVKGKEEVVMLDVSNHGIQHFVGSGSFIDDPMAHFGEWSEFLWQEYEGCYYDPETKQYVYDE